MRETSPKPVEGRKHIDVQTELYLEEITGEILVIYFFLYVVISHHYKMCLDIH